MADTPRRPPASMPWRTFQKEPPPPTSGSFGGTLGALAIAVGVGALGCVMLDLHSHRCDQCGRRWRHFGAFNLGDEPSHTCSRCGEIQWWKCGAPHVLRGSQFVEFPSSPALPSSPIHMFAAHVVPPAFSAPVVSPAFTAPVGAISPGSTPSALPPSRRPMLAIQSRRVLR